jgi:Apea-like HEPN
LAKSESSSMSYNLPIVFHKFLSTAEQKPTQINTSVQETQTEVNDVIMALRLQKSGTAGYSYIDCRDKLKVPVQVGQSLSTGPFTSYGDKKFLLTKPNISEIQRLYSELKILKSSENLVLSLALERFSSAYSNASLEDKIIDFAICYEVLFSKEGDGIDSVTHKLAVRFSRLVTENYDERVCLYRRIKNLYTKRSQIVHGNKVLSQEEKKAAATEFEDFMRLSLKRYIDRYRSNRYRKHGDLIEELDFG